MKNISFAIIIHTKNRSWTFRKTIESISRFYSKDDSVTVIVVDDSSCKISQAENKKILLESNLLKVWYVDSDRWQEVKRLAAFYFFEDENALLDKISLGEPAWNTHNTRNIGKLLLVSTKIADISLFLDDDMVLLKKLKLPFDFDKSQVPVWGLKLSGCPDLTRLEWVQLYLASHQKHLYIPNKTDKTLDAEYIDCLISELSMEKIYELVIQYTDFSINNKATTKKTLINSDKLPQRLRISGGAYICRVDDADVSSFPMWYNEDWNWFDMIIRKYNRDQQFNFKLANPVFLDDYIVHNADKKKVLDLDLMLFEEHGKICLKLSKCLAENLELKEEDYSMILQERVEELNSILNQINLLTNNSITKNHDYEIKKIFQVINLTLEKLLNQDKQLYKNALTNFSQSNLIWQFITDKLKYSTQLGKHEQWQKILEETLKI